MSAAVQSSRAALRLNTCDILIEARDGNLWTTSLEVAKRFGKLHKNVLRAVENLECSAEFSRLNFEPRDYIDERGKQQSCYEITRDGFSFLAMGFTGKEAATWKEKFIAAFNQMERKLRRIAIQKADPVRLLAVREKCASAGFMTDCLIDARAAQGKATKPHHFSTEHSLCNWVLTGSFEGVEDDGDLDAPALRRLTAIRRRNSMLILKGVPYQDRKDALHEAFPLVATLALEEA